MCGSEKGRHEREVFLNRDFPCSESSDSCKSTTNPKTPGIMGGHAGPGGGMTISETKSEGPIMPLRGAWI